MRAKEDPDALRLNGTDWVLRAKDFSKEDRTEGPSVKTLIGQLYQD